MKRKCEVALLVLLPVLIIAALVYNAGVMNRIYILENGLDKDSKICKARILPDKYDVSAKQGEKITLDIKVANQGNFVWKKSGSNPVHLSYHLLDSNKKILQLDNERVEVPHDIRPDDEFETNVKLDCRQEPGDYILEFDMVEEGVTWFEAKGSPTTLIKLHITE